MVFFMAYDFKFSVLMPIYNVEEYLSQAIDSLIDQSIGFEENIELVIVDDGSPDRSKEIALKYHEKYPDNIKVLSKPNGGQASAFNLGLNHLHGKYISFFDSDDCLSPNVFEDVYNFFQQHYDEIDIVCIPLIFFERRTGPHILNFKFDSTRVIDLVKEPNNPLLSLNSSFLKKEALEGVEFDTILPHAYDALAVNKILLEKKKLGVVSTCNYYYRKRNDNTSMIDTAKSKEEYYNYVLKNYFLALIDYSMEKEGHIPKFIQYMMAYDIQWFYTVPDFPDYFTEDKIDEFWHDFSEILSHIDDEIINDSIIIRKKMVRSFLMYIKNHKDFHIDIAEVRSDARDGNDFHIDAVENKSKIYLKTGDNTINNLHNHRFYIDDIRLDDGILRLLGTFTSECDYDALNIEAIKTLPDGTEEVYKEEWSDFSIDNSKIKRILGIDWQFKHCFDLKIPIEKDEESKIDLFMIYDENDKKAVMNNKIKFRKSELLTDIVNCFVKDSHIVHFKENSFRIYPFSNEKFNEIKEELLLQNQKTIGNAEKIKNENKALKKENKILKKKNKKLKKELRESKEKNNQILNSSSWKVTKPIRKFKQWMKKD